MRGAFVAAFGVPENINICEDLPVPAISKPDQVLIDVHTSGVNPVDTYIRAGAFPVLPPLPYVPGIDGAGVVREIGADVSHLCVGDRVWFYTYAGSTAEVAVTNSAFKLPKSLSFTEGACLGIPYTTAYRAMFTKGHIKSTDRVLIHGASGGVGLAACQLASFASASLIVGAAGTQQGLDAILRNGAHHAVNHREEGYVDKLKKLAPEGFDLIIEVAAATNLLVDIDLLARGGRLGLIGGEGQVSVSPSTLWRKELTVYGVVANGATTEDRVECAAALERMFTETAHRPVVNKTYSLDETAQCHRDLRDTSLTTVGNRVIIVKE